MILRTVTYPDKEMLYRREWGAVRGWGGAWEEAENEGRDGIKKEKKKLK